MAPGLESTYREVMQGTPHPALRPYVSAYVGYHQIGGLPEVHHGIASPSATLIVAFDAPLDVSWPHRPESRGRFWTLAAGMHTTAALIRTHQRQHGIQLQLTPLGCRRLLGVPAGALARQFVAHEDVPLGLADDVHARLLEASTWRERFAILDRALLTAWRRSPDADAHPAATESWRFLESTRGLMSIEHLAREIGWSRRHLTQRFVAEYGLAPKEAARLFRFQRARHLSRRGLQLVRVADVAGYADQAHLTREWRAFAGQPPTRTRAEEMSFVPDPPPNKLPREAALVVRDPPRGR